MIKFIITSFSVMKDLILILIEIIWIILIILFLPIAIIFEILKALSQIVLIKETVDILGLNSTVKEDKKDSNE